MLKADNTQKKCFVACDEQTKKDGRCSCLTNTHQPLQLLQTDVITSFLGLDRPYSLDSVLEKLIETSDILMHQKNYDGNGWEILKEAREQAVIYKNQIHDYLRQINE
jgi:hypothetical protein